jgi:Undecaprenyl-phosphate galactose phosphotransferase WbaP
MAYEDKRARGPFKLDGHSQIAPVESHENSPEANHRSERLSVFGLGRQRAGAFLGAIELRQASIAQTSKPAVTVSRRRLFVAMGLLAGDATSLACSIALAGFICLKIDPLIFSVQFVGFQVAHLSFRFAEWGVFIACLCAWFALTGHYSVRRPFRAEGPKIWNVLLVGLLFDAFVQFASKDAFSRLWLVTTWCIAALAVPFARIFVRKLLNSAGVWRSRALIVGSGRHLLDISEALARDWYLGYEAVSDVNLASLMAQPNADSSGRVASAMAVLGAELLILVPNDTEFSRLDQMINVLNTRLIRYAVVPPVSKLPLAGLNVHMFLHSDAMLLSVSNGLTSKVSQSVKRAFDLCASLVLLVFLSPLFALLSIIIASDGGPVFFGHNRVGRAKRDFVCLKFRTMVPNAQQILADTLARNPAMKVEWERHYKLQNDPRITRIGNFLRRTSIDELPQLINVLRGDMSLVGPRPVVAAELTQYYGENSSYYVLVRPGITGLWQISGRSETDYSRRVFLDEWYIRNWNLWTDILILFGTPPAVLSRRGAV